MGSSYLELSPEELEKRAQIAYQRMACCTICARACEVNRVEGETGVCNTGLQAKVSSYGPHLGEEDPLRGWRGSGTIFFTRCNLRCVFCQNHDISQADAGAVTSAPALAEIMLNLQARGCHNINFVSPSHVVPQILAALPIAIKGGLKVPLVYNTGGYDSLETIKLLDGIVDIYMPDMKFADGGISERLTVARDYPQVNQAAVKEMHSQVGDLELDENGIAVRGLLVRHLLLPGGKAGTRKIVTFLAEEISRNTYLNLMTQYRPVYRASNYPEINRPIWTDEFSEAKSIAIEAGLTRFD